MYEFEHCLWILPKAFDFVGRSIGGEPELLNSPAFSGLKHCLCDRVPLFVYITDQGSAVFVGHIANRLLRISHHRMILLSAFNLVLLIRHASSNHLPFIHILFDLFFCHPAHLRAREFLILLLSEYWCHDVAGLILVLFQKSLQFFLPWKYLIRDSAFYIRDLINPTGLLHSIIRSAQIKFCNIQRLKREIPPPKPSLAVLLDTDAAAAGSTDILGMVPETILRIQ